MKKSPFKTGSLAVRLMPLWILIFLLNTTISSSALHSLELGMEAPDFSLTDLNGRTQSFPVIKGDKLTIVLFWATWSENSKKALKQMQSLHDKYKDSGLAVIGINVDKQEATDETLGKIRDTSTSLNITFPLLVDSGLTTFNSFGIIAVPSTLILDNKRIITYELSGFPLMRVDSLKDFVEVVIENKKIPAEKIATGYQPDKKAVRLWNMGMSSQKSERNALKSKGWFEKAIAADPEFILPYISLGAFYYKQHNLVEAKKQFELALQKKPDNAIALSSLGQVLLDEGNFSDAETVLTKAIKVDEAYLPSYYYLGLLKGKQGNPAQALLLFNQAEQLNPRDYKLFVYKGMAYEELKDLATAAASYKKALGLVIEHP
jgi:peroxiredoxin/Tfp pilus assembly protein PilF